LQEIETNNGLIINFPMEDEYTLLVRIVGPFFGFIAVYYFSLSFLNDNSKLPIFPVLSMPKIIENSKNIKPSESFINSLLRYKQVIILASNPLLKLAETLSEKLMEGLYMQKPHIFNFLDFSHGIFQSQEVIRKNEGKITCFILLNNGSANDGVLIDSFKNMVTTKYPIWELKSELHPDFQILHYDVIVNYLVADLIIREDIDQINFPVSESKSNLYTLKSLP